LQADTGKTRGALGWMPPISEDIVLRKTAEDFYDLSIMSVN
jgi:hypothetical protein